MTKFSKRLRELRNSKDLSQQLFADKIGISKSSINMYERGEREPGLEMLENMADFFNVDLDYLLGKSDIPNKSLELLQRNISVEKANTIMQHYHNIVNTATPEDLRTLALYKKLDEHDKAEICGEIKGMLKADKYKSQF